MFSAGEYGKLNIIWRYHESTYNKKVLRERKRHTDRGVSSTPSVVLYWGGGGYPCLGTPIEPGWGTPPHQNWLGYPPPWLGVSDLAGVPPCPVLDGWGYPHWLDLTGVTPPPPRGQTDRHVSKHNLPVVLRTRSVINNLYGFCWSVICNVMEWMKYDLNGGNYVMYLDQHKLNVQR